MDHVTLPIGWSYVKLRDCCDIVSGATPRRDHPEYWGGDIPWVTPKDLSDLKVSVLKDAPEYITEQGYKNCSTTLLPKGSILFSSRAPIGLVAIAGRPMCTNQGFKSLIPGNDVDTGYLYHCMKSLVPRIQDMGRGATFAEISKDLFGEVEIPLPKDTKEQKRIAAILDKADAIRSKRQQAIQLADEFLRSVFLDMFGDVATNSRGWSRVKLALACIKITDGTHHSPPAVSHGIPYVTAKHIKKGRIDFESAPTYVGEEDHRAIYSRCNPRLGDVLYIKDGATTGIAAINSFTFEFSMLSSVALLRPNTDILNEAYLCDWLNNDRVKMRALQGVAGAAITRLTLSKIKEFEIELPPIKLQQKYATIREKYSRVMERQTRHLKASTDNFRGLSQSAFRGGL